MYSHRRPHLHKIIEFNFSRNTCHPSLANNFSYTLTLFFSHARFLPDSNFFYNSHFQCSGQIHNKKKKNVLFIIGHQCVFCVLQRKWTKAHFDFGSLPRIFQKIQQHQKCTSYAEANIFSAQDVMDESNKEMQRDGQSIKLFHMHIS